MLYKLKLLIPLLILLTACSPNTDKEVVEDISVNTTEENVSQEWHVVSSDDFWNGNLITIHEESLVLEQTLPDSMMRTMVTYNFDKEAEFLSTSEILKYEFFVSHDYVEELFEDDSNPFQYEDFKIEEGNEGNLFTLEKTDYLEEHNDLVPTALHIYEHEAEDFLEVVVIADQAPKIFLGTPADATLEYTSNISELYQSLNDSLREMTMQGAQKAQVQLDEILSVIPNSLIAIHYRELITEVKQYLTAFMNMDGDMMQSQIEAINEINYSNLYGVYTVFANHHDKLSPHMDEISKVDGYLKNAADFINNHQYESAELELEKMSGLYDILNTYYSSKSNSYTDMQDRLEEVRIQNQIKVSDFHGYWADVSAPYNGIEPGQVVLYISDQHYAFLVMNSDHFALGRVEAARVVESQLILEVFFEGDDFYEIESHTNTVSLSLEKGNTNNRIIDDSNGENMTFHPINGKEVTITTGWDLTEILYEMYP